MQRQSSTNSKKKASVDPDNDFLWRFTPRRLEAEIVRDSILASAGQLDATMYGPGTLDERHRRRSIYFKYSVDQQDKFLTMFDDADVLQ